MDLTPDDRASASPLAGQNMFMFFYYQDAGTRVIKVNIKKSNVK
jgi:hypothetical protein